MYRKPRFLEKLHAIRENLAEACGYDAEQLAALLRCEPSPGPAASPDEPPAPSFSTPVPSQSGQ